MRAGLLRHRLTLKKPVTTRDSVGGEVITWTTFTTVWGAVWPLRGTEYMGAQQIQSAVSHRIRIRQLPADLRSSFDSKCRITFGTRTFHIESIINVDERDIYLEIMATEETA